MGLFDFLTEEIAIDLGTANTLIIHKDKVVVDSPSIVARDLITNKIIAVGREAQLMQGKTYERIKTIRPLKDGVIADFDASEQMINAFIKSIPALKKRLFSPSLKIVVCIPSGITEVEISHREVAKALDKSILRIEDAIMETLSQTPPELAADIYNTGIYMAGGGSMLRGLDKRISMRTDLPVYVAEDPLRAVVRGTGITLKNIEKFKAILEK